MAPTVVRAMKVRCIKIIDEFKRTEEDASPWLTKGDIYTVIGIFVVGRGEQKFLLAPKKADDPGLFSVSQFEVVDLNIPTCWRVALDRYGNLQIAPEELLDDTFWDRFNEGNSEAMRLFLEIISKV